MASTSSSRQTERPWSRTAAVLITEYDGDRTAAAHATLVARRYPNGLWAVRRTDGSSIWLNGGTNSVGGPTWSRSRVALYSDELVAAIVLVLEDDFRVVAVRLF